MTVVLGQPQADLALVIARQAHDGQTDQAGEPYSHHPARVAYRLRAAGADDHTQAAAWLHDVLEDTTLTVEDLHDFGVAPAVVAAVELLTKRPEERLEVYWARVRTNPIALAVKRADVADNADPRRLARLDFRTRKRLTDKYARAAAALGPVPAA